IGSGEGACLQIVSPLVVHGQTNGEDDTFLLPKPMVFTVTSDTGSVSSFNVNPSTFGAHPAILGTTPQGFTAMGTNSTARAVTCTDSFWDLIFDIATKGETDGDMVTLFVQNPNGSGVQVLAMFTVQSGGLILNQLHPNITFLVNGNGPFSAGYFIP